MSFVFDKLKSAVDDVKNSVRDAVPSGGAQKHTHSHTHHSGICSDGDFHHLHRFQSFAPQRQGNDVKWYVDGCGYFWAVSIALEQAQHQIWILDWWLSPELYLRRPPAKNEQYRLDRMLFAAAKRGVKVNVIVYKEVTQALTLSSSHTKHWLEDNDKTGNIRVFRHPDHLPDRQTLASSFLSSIKESGLHASKLAQLPGDALKGLYGMTEDTILYWAHHEKLCIVDGKIAFMGGLDLCFGRWDTNQHSIADAHPYDLNDTVFPGQDYNNARIMDFKDVAHWQNNKLDRRYNSRMGWSDISVSIQGPVVDDLRAHFAQRWNFIYFEKYDVRKDQDYHPIEFGQSRVGVIGHPYDGESNTEKAGTGHYAHFQQRMEEQLERTRTKLERTREKQGAVGDDASSYQSFNAEVGRMDCQIMRSCCKWSHGVRVEHSIANAYIDTIRNSEHFVYIENQFFITATSEEQDPVKNLLGRAIADRIIKAGENNEDWLMIVNIPALPGFAGDLRSDEASSTRAIMKFQYESISKGRHSIMDVVKKAGVNPTKYIRFYNLRNYDRIHTSPKTQQIEQKAGVKYDDAVQGYDQRCGVAGDAEKSRPDGPDAKDTAFEQYQQAAPLLHSHASGQTADTIAPSYMLDKQDVENVPWEGDPKSELDAFVSEELYIHTKMLIADDKTVIIGSANLNDRSQLGSHDSEIAILIEDTTTISSSMACQPYIASKFAASLRRQVFRKHLGLLPPQDMQVPDANFLPITQEAANAYDWDSAEDQAVADPLSPAFLQLWTTTARTNTEAFRRVFHAVPDDYVKNWKAYDEFYEKYFRSSEAVKENKEGLAEKPATWRIGHVVTEEFSDGVAGLSEVKEVLGRVKGNLVEMPLEFLAEEDIEPEGISLNPLMAQVYT